MAENNNELSKEIENSGKENEALQQHLLEAGHAIDPIENKDSNIDEDKPSEKIFQILIENMHEGAVMINKEGTILYCNSCFADMLDRPLVVNLRIILARFQKTI